MFRLPRALPFLFAAGVVLCSCAAAQADESGDVRPPDVSVTAGPRDVRVDAPDTYVESAPERVVVCVGEVRVVIGPGGCPVPPPAFLPEPVPDPGRVFPEVLAPAPAPETATVPAGTPAGTPAAPAAPESPGPESPGPQTPPAPEPTDPLATVETAPVVETAHSEPLLAADRPTADDTASGVFTPMRTMVIIAVVGAVAAAGAGRAGATRRG